MSTKKKILLLTRPIGPPWDEGSKDFAYTLAKYTQDFEVHLLTCGKVAELPGNVVQHPIYTSLKLNLAQKLRLLNFLRSFSDYDIAHSLFTPTRTNSLFLRFSLKKGAKTIQTVATLREDLYSAREFKKIIFADLVITYSDYAKEKLEKIGFSNTKRIYPGIDLNIYSPAPKKPELMKKFETAENDFVINYTGEYVRLGDMDDIVEVFSELVLDPRFHGDDKKSRFKLHLAVRVKNQKDAEKKEEVKARFEKEGLINRVAFIDDGSYVMEDIFNLCDVSIFPARTMAGKFDIPLVVPEAMACGKPVIASSLERLRYFLNDNNSILIEPGDQAALKEKILYLYNNPAARRELGEKGMRFARENFDIMKVVKEYEEVYKNI
ncbi:MAG: glycosyltransferase family 4 protein [Patescibacteria group bacterium]|nr:glycosyltransferase family 4 protein [Patescibacteria group bacterium]